jgi:hypothetical protein
MNRLFPCFGRVASISVLAGVALLCLSLVPSGPRSLLAAAAETDGEVTARETALELAGAFVNDGYKIRDGHWSGQLQPNVPQVMTVSLYAGNQYYFSLGYTDKAKKATITVYDETGKVVDGEQFFQDKLRSAAGVSPVASGPYYVSVQLVEGDATDFCVLYSYK